MKKILTAFIVISFLSNPLHAQNSWQWIHHGGPNSGNGLLSGQRITGMEVDSIGNVYIAGRLNSDNGAQGMFSGLGSFLLQGGSESFLAKYDCQGNGQWLKVSSNWGNDMITAMTMDDAGHLYVTGRAKHSANQPFTFGPDTIKTSSFWLSKYNTAGGLVWSYETADIPFSSGRSIQVVDDKLFTIIEDWAFPPSYPSADIMPGVAAGTDAMVIAAWDTSGQGLWAKSIGPVSLDDMILHKGDQALLVTGSFDDSLHFMGHSFYNNFSNDFSDCYIAELDLNGNLNWISVISDTTIDNIRSPMPLHNGNILSTFSYNYFNDDPKVFLGDTLRGWNDNIQLGQSGGMVEWGNNLSVNNHAMGTSQNNNFHLFHFTQHRSDLIATGISIGGYAMGSDTVSHIPGWHIPILTFDQNLNLKSGMHLMADQNALAEWVRTDQQGNVYVAGNFKSKIATGTTLETQASGPGHVFVAKYGKASCYSGIGMVEDQSEPNINVFPNPASSYIKVSTDLQADEIVFFDIQGRKVAVLQVQEKQERISLPPLNFGPYILQFWKDGQTVHAQQLLIE